MDGCALGCLVGCPEGWMAGVNNGDFVDLVGLDVGCRDGCIDG